MSEMKLADVRRLLELEEKASVGPWYTRLEGDDVILYDGLGDSLAEEATASQADCDNYDFMAETRNTARPLAETLIEAVGLLRDLTKWVEGCDEAYDEPHAARAFLDRLGE